METSTRIICVLLALYAGSVLCRGRVASEAQNRISAESDSHFQRWLSPYFPGCRLKNSQIASVAENSALLPRVGHWCTPLAIV